MDLLLEFGGTDNGYGLWQHHLVGAVSVEVNTGEEGCLRGMSLRREKKAPVRIHRQAWPMKKVKC